jgi:hypothetical protein
MGYPGNRWVTLVVNEPGRYHAHIMPRDDVTDHEPFPDCWCEPVADPYEHDIYIHNALDGREQREMERMRP